MNAKQYHEKYTVKCKKCNRFLMCRKHQLLWHKKVESKPAVFESDEQGKNFMAALNGIASKI